MRNDYVIVDKTFNLAIGANFNHFKNYQQQ